MKMLNLLKLFQKVLNHPKILQKMSYNKKIARLTIHLRKKNPCTHNSLLTSSVLPFQLHFNLFP